MQPETPRELIDRFGRHISYLRMSVTDRCDFRCVYCMAEDVRFLPRAEVLSLEELLTVARAFTELGVTKIRMTGGEPLVRANVLWLLERVAKLSGLDELSLTTNGSQLPRYATRLRAAGLCRVNISLDSLRPERFRRLTRTGDLARVLAGIEAAREAGFERIKLNAVILRNRNHDEVVDLVRFAIERDLDVAFIEEMPLGVITDHERSETYYSSDAIREDLERHFALLATTESTGGPARYFRVPGSATRVGFISPHSHNFCAACNRVRLTATGRLLLCLGRDHAVDLKSVLRAHPNDGDALKRVIVAALAIKPAGHEFGVAEQPVLFRHMHTTGG